MSGESMLSNGEPDMKPSDLKRRGLLKTAHSLKRAEQPRISRRTLLRGGAALTAAGLGFAGLAWLRWRERGNGAEQVSWSQLWNNQAAYEGHRIQIVTYGVIVGVVNTFSRDGDIFQGTLESTSQTDITSIVQMYRLREEAVNARNPKNSSPFLIAVDSEKAPVAIPYLAPDTTATMKVDPNAAAVALYQLTGRWTKNTGQIGFIPQSTAYFLSVEQATILEKIR